jgi:Ca-activated chloride channel family protein
LFAAGLVVLGTGAARPHASVPVPSNAATILLAMDVSGSMCSTDVLPNRLSIAQQAAREFIKAQDDGTRIGLITFSGIAGLLVEPTTDTKTLLEAIDTLRTGRGTAIGLAILASIDAISEINPSVPPTGIDMAGDDPTAGNDSGEYQPETIVVLTDGRNTHGVTPQTAAAEAAARQIRVYTIGFGTSQPSPMVCSRDQISGDATRPEGRGGFSGGGGGGFGRFQVIDEDTLEQVAETTGGDYFKAVDAKQLNEVLLDLPNTIVMQREFVEITVWFALIGALLIVVAVGLAQWWNRSFT